MTLAALLSSPSLATGAGLSSKRRMIGDPSTANLSGLGDIVSAARQRLEQAQQDHQHALQYTAQQTLLQAAMNKQKRMMRQQALVPRGVSYAPASTMPMPTGNLAQWIRKAIKLTDHTGMGLAPGIRNIIMHEDASLNPYAVNRWDSNAKAGTPSIGLMQTIQPTFDAHALKGHTNIYNPVDNIIAGLRYALSRYGHQMVRSGGRHDAAGNYLGY